jgi:hypothetical protein
MGKSTSSYIGNLFVGFWQTPMAALGTKWNATDETRPTNVAVLFCQYSGGAGATPAGSNQIIQGNSSLTVTDSGTDGRIALTTEGVDRISVAASGNVGIGTLTPQQKLAVNGSISSSVIGTYCGASASTTGNIGGYAAAKALCVTACGNPNAHMCTAHEISISGQLGISMQIGSWYSSNTLMTYSPDRQTFDCDGWRSAAATIYGPEVFSSDGRPDSNPCNESRPVACCL